jgi:hypothetical protein
MAYMPPVRNPLRRLPVRAYRSPIPSRLPGLGQVGTPGGCPGSPGCPGNVQPIDIYNLPLIGPYTNPSPMTAAQLGIAASGLNPALAKAGPFNFTDWLNTNSSTVLWISGVALSVLLISRMAR